MAAMLGYDSMFADRVDAGRRLAGALRRYAGRGDLLVLGLPRGGVVTAAEVARVLGAPLDIMPVRKLGLPGEPEVAMGAIAPGPVRVINQELTDQLGVTIDQIEQVTDEEVKELQRRQRAYRGSRSEPAMEGRCVFLIDDGLATGYTMLAAARAVRMKSPARTIVAVPVASAQGLKLLEGKVDEIVCPVVPPLFISVSQWYVKFPQVTDAQVCGLLAATVDR